MPSVQETEDTTNILTDIPSTGNKAFLTCNVTTKEQEERLWMVVWTKSEFQWCFLGGHCVCLMFDYNWICVGVCFCCFCKPFTKENERETTTWS